MKLSLQGKLSAVTIIVIAIISICLGTLSYSQLKASRDKLINSEAQAQATAFKSYLSSWASDHKNIMQGLAEQLDIELQSGPLDHQKILRLLSQTKTSGDFALTFVGLEDGTMYRHDPSLDKSGYDPRVRDWYKSAKTEQQPLITAPYIAATGKKLAITFVYPLIVNGKFAGAIGGLFYMDKIVNNVLSMAVQGDGYAMLFDRRNVIAAYPEQSLILKEPTVLSPSFSQSNLLNLASKNSISAVTINQQKMLVYLGTIPHTEWILGLAMKKSVLDAPLFSLLLKTLLIVVILIVIAAIGASFLIRWLFKDLRNVSEGLSNIASGNGDLTLRIQTNSTDEIGQLAHNFNSFVQFLHGIISRLRDICDELVEQAATTTRTSDRSETQIHSQQQEVTLVATAVNEMTVATQEIANNAANTAQTSDNAVSLSNSGQIQVHQSQESINKLASELQSTMNAISELDSHVQEISSILTTISGIAEQTNLLALNAAIEAARAGEQGRGFAVVADEVRSLSQRTHSSTEEIRNMIEVLQRSTHHAVSSMTNSRELADHSVNDTEAANRSFEEIRQSIETINEMATQIATAAEEQTSVTSEINENTTNIHSAAEELALVATESSRQAGELAKLSERLRQDIGLFKL
ncbi:methyl-accepting chemotaxis protein [Celerinatantimonas sp. YJH-8]|uniref:methyl-accepting chemotaxis protein n=1 Tax=Celerinatantimonas sp. YJH-8 TaxID=3228714 RepID=UPI0038CB29F6